MAWERRRNGTYYYRTLKEQGRVIKEYVGTGPVAEVAAERDAVVRAARAEAVTQLHQEQAAFQALDRPVADFAITLETLTRAHLVRNGYHRHHGGEWRRRRHA
jgi:hypothetical protein